MDITHRIKLTFTVFATEKERACISHGENSDYAQGIEKHYRDALYQVHNAPNAAEQRRRLIKIGKAAIDYKIANDKMAKAEAERIHPHLRAA